MNGPLTGKSALVTGGGRGIGRAIALALAGAGANVALFARTLSELNAVKKEIEAVGKKAIVVQGDVSNAADVEKGVGRTIEEFSTVDILINNAGIGSFANVAELSRESFDRMWEVNVRGVFLATKAVLPIMTKHRSGDILNLASLAGRNAFVGGSGYCATKWALIGFMRCLMLEVREQNIRVVTLCPGSVETDFGDHAKHAPNPAIPKAEDIARVALDALLMPRNVMVSEIDIRPTNPKG